MNHDCNAYCRNGTHAEVIRAYSSEKEEAMDPERFARVWARELRRDLGEVLNVQWAHEVEWPDGPLPERHGAYLVTYRP